jgi:hypothetical protein
MNDALKRHGLNDLTYLARVFGTLVILSVLLGVGVQAYQMVRDQVMPASYWFKYYSVAPAKESFKVGERLEFISRYEIYHNTSMHWNDILYCECADGCRFESEYSSYELHKLPTDGTRIIRWMYNAAVPTKPTICKLRSVIIAEPKFGSDKTQILNEEIWFEIVE